MSKNKKSYQIINESESESERLSEIDLEAGEGNKYEEGVDEVAKSCCSWLWCSPESDHFVDSKKVLIRRVYMALTCQIILTAGIVMGIITNPTPLTWVLQYSTPIVISALVVAIVCMIFLFCGGQKMYPANLIVLTLFTIFMALDVAIGCAAVVCQVDIETKTCLVNDVGLELVAEAFVITLVVFISLTAYELITKKDFSCLGGILFISLIILVFWGFFIAIFGWSTSMLYILFGIFIFVGYILYDTSNIVHVYEPEDWIPATIQLYLDIINLFLYILQLLAKIRGSD